MFSYVCLLVFPEHMENVNTGKKLIPQKFRWRGSNPGLSGESRVS
jgi:hypothetical protein